MTTHEVACLFDALRTGLGASLKANVALEYEEVAQTFRDLPDQPLKTFMTQVRKSFNPPAAPNGKKQPIDIDNLVMRIRDVTTNPSDIESLKLEIGILTEAQLKAILSQFGLKAARGKPKHQQKVLDLLTTPIQDISQPNQENELIEQSVRLFEELKADPEVTIEQIRSRLEPIRHYPKAVVEEISRRVGYSADSTREKTYERMLSNLEGIKMSQLRSKMILS